MPDPRGSGESESLLRLVLELLALMRRNFLLVGICVIASFAVLAAILRDERPEYRASAVVRLSDKARSMSGGLGTRASDQLGVGADPILSQLQILQSGAVAREIALEEGLQLRPMTRDFTWAFIDSARVASTAPVDSISLQFGDTSFTATLRGRAVRARYGAVVDLMGARFTVSRRPPVPSAQLMVRSLAAATSEITLSLRGHPRDRTDIVDVTYQTDDAVRAERTVNAAVRVFQNVNARSARSESVRRREFIEQRLHKAEEMLSEAQLAYNAFRRREQVYSSRDKFQAQQSDLAALEIRRQELASDRHIYASLLTTLDSMPEGPAREQQLNAIVSSPIMASNPGVSARFAELLRLRTARDSATTGTFAASPTNPDVRRLDALIAAAQTNVLTAVRGQLTGIDARLSALEEMHARAAAAIVALPGAEAQENGLQTQVQTYEREAERLREELQKAQIEEAAEAGQVELIDPAITPAATTGSGRSPKIAFALVMGLVLGTISAYILENHKDVIRRREELAVISALPNLALVPRFRKIPGAKRWLPFAFRDAKPKPAAKSPVTTPAPTKHVVSFADIHSPGAEAYRTLRTNLLFSAAVQSLHRVVVTSAAPKEGKSTTAANLAAACAQQGQKVLLIDCDLRGPTVHSLYNRPRAPGLTNVLIGTVSIEDAIHSTALPELMVLTAGTTPPNPAELLGSPKMAKLLEDAAGRFDLVIIDTPPLLAASDAAILGRIADGTLMVVRAGQTQRVAVQEAIQQLHTVGARVLGTVLNDPDAEIAKFAPYYYQYYHSYYHARGRT
jgi:tyrosine-protein kinase Etk/Wzc